jgi:uncharacterized repeat protein (TIGR03943 family)
MIRDMRYGPGYFDHGHTHRPAMAWALVIPIVVLVFIVPPAIGPRTSGITVVEVSTEVLRRPFPPLPSEPAPAVSLPEVLTRVAEDTSGTLDGRLITVTGFTMKEAGHTDLARVAIKCCAADARLARIRLSGSAAAEAAGHPDNTWLRVEGKVAQGQRDSAGTSIPALEVSRVTPIEQPANPYAY